MAPKISFSVLELGRPPAEYLCRNPAVARVPLLSIQSGFQCPTCKKVYGVKMGNMPDGTMKVTTNKRSSLPGHEGYGTIQITYDFKPGIHVCHISVMCPL